MKAEEKAIRFLMSYFNASEFEDSRDEFTESWVAVAGCLKTYTEQEIKELKSRLERWNKASKNEEAALKQEIKELREALAKIIEEMDLPMNESDHKVIEIAKQALKK
jgi:esterase/lipase